MDILQDISLLLFVHLGWCSISTWFKRKVRFYNVWLGFYLQTCELLYIYKLNLGLFSDADPVSRACEL